jgi:hypothetical protein
MKFLPLYLPWQGKDQNRRRVDRFHGGGSANGVKMPEVR